MNSDGGKTVGSEATRARAARRAKTNTKRWWPWPSLAIVRRLCAASLSSKMEADMILPKIQGRNRDLALQADLTSGSLQHGRRRMSQRADLCSTGAAAAEAATVTCRFADMAWRPQGAATPYTLHRCTREKTSVDRDKRELPRHTRGNRQSGRRHATSPRHGPAPPCRRSGWPTRTGFLPKPLVGIKAANQGRGPLSPPLRAYRMTPLPGRHGHSMRLHAGPINDGESMRPQPRHWPASGPLPRILEHVERDRNAFGHGWSLRSAPRRSGACVRRPVAAHVQARGKRHARGT